MRIQDPSYAEIRRDMLSKHKHEHELVDIIEQSCSLLTFAIARVELANQEGDPILSAWLEDAKRHLAQSYPTLPLPNKTCKR